MGELESRAQIQIIRILVEEGYTEQDFVWKEHIREWRLSEAAAGSEELIRLLARYRLPVWSLSSLCNLLMCQNTWASDLD